MTGERSRPPFEPGVIYGANGRRMRRDERPPGATLAEALGIDVPKNAPGGARVLPASAGSSANRRAHESGQWSQNDEYDGFGDLDGWTKAEP